MYPRTKELNEVQKNMLISDSEFAQQIGIDILTLKKVRAGNKIFSSTARMIDNFLDNPVNNNVDVAKLLAYKAQHTDLKYEDLAEQIGVSNKTLFNAIQRKSVSTSTRKLIKDFLSTKVVNV